MKNKKHPSAKLENYSKLFTQLGLVLSLLIVYVLIQSKSFTGEVIVFNNVNTIFIDDIPSNVEVTIIKPKPKRKVAIKVIKQITEDSPIEEDIIDIIDPDTPVEAPIFIKVDPVEGDNIIDEVPFLILEDVPVFPGCKGTNDETKACFIKQISKFINRKFDTSIAEELGLPSGTQRIFTLFKIDKNGNIVDVQAKAPHKRLQQEAIRVINLLPKMVPGKQRGNPVIVKYSLPITFKIQ